MLSLGSSLLYLPTILFWSLLLILFLSEFVGYFAATIRKRFRICAVAVLLMLATWYAAETANSVALTPPDFTPWSHWTEPMHAG